MTPDEEGMTSDEKLVLRRLDAVGDQLAAAKEQIFDVLEAIRRDGLTAEVKAKQKAATAAAREARRALRRINSGNGR